MRTINIHEAKTHLSRFLGQVESGEEIIIARAGKPIARLSRYEPPRRQIAPPGSLEGQGQIAGDFDAPAGPVLDVSGELATPDACES